MQRPGREGGRVEGVRHMERLDGRVAIITGGAQGIGLGIAKVLRAEGADVVIADINEESASKAAASLPEADAHALAIRADVTSEADLRNVAAETLRHWGRIDILAANAGIYPHISLSGLRIADWDRVMAINVTGAMLAIQACMGPMTERGYGRIVLSSSITGSIVGQPGYVHYGASKAALLGLMRSAALELADAGITVNAVLPGNIRTPGFADLGAEHEQRMLAAIPAHRFGEPEEVGWAVRFLASHEAAFITGQTLVIDGGQVLPESEL
jgi:3-oxoacyl-[acyl-carrier protein] reductase